MKATFNLPWNQMREIARWLKTFGVKFSSEKHARLQGEEWTGEGLQVNLLYDRIAKKTQ